MHSYMPCYFVCILSLLLWLLHSYVCFTASLPYTYGSWVLAAAVWNKFWWFCATTWKKQENSTLLIELGAPLYWWLIGFLHFFCACILLCCFALSMVLSIRHLLLWFSSLLSYLKWIFIFPKNSVVLSLF